MTINNRNNYNILLILFIISIILLIILASCSPKIESKIIKNDSIVYRDSVRIIEKIVHKEGSKVYVPIDCGKKDTVFIKIGNTTARLTTNRGIANLNLINENSTDTIKSSSHISSKNESKTNIEYKTIEKNIYPFWYIWVILIISLVLNMWYIYKSIIKIKNE